MNLIPTLNELIRTVKESFSSVSQQKVAAADSHDASGDGTFASDLILDKTFLEISVVLDTLDAADGTVAFKTSQDNSSWDWAAETEAESTITLPSGSSVATFRTGAFTGQYFQVIFTSNSNSSGTIEKIIYTAKR